MANANTAEGLSATALFWSVCGVVRDIGIDVNRRGGMVREMVGPTTLLVEDPTRYLCMHPKRKLNPWASLIEFPWLMCGRNDVAWLLPVIPGAANFADDGMTWRAGYGPRMRKWPNTTGMLLGRPVVQGVVDQVEHVIQQLTSNQFTRQAIISLWDPARDTVAGSRDYPCTQTVHFMCAPDGHLDCYVHMRSNDLVWGASGANIPNWCLLQQLVAAASGLEIGTYYHVADNLHVYERHFPMLQSVARDISWHRADLHDTPPMAPHELRLLPAAMYAVEHYAQRHAMEVTRDSLAAHITAEAGMEAHACGYAVQWAHFMLLWHLLNDTPRRRAVAKRAGSNPLLVRTDQALSEVASMTWRLAAAAWMVRAETPHLVELGTQHVRDTLKQDAAAYLHAIKEGSDGDTE